jgi:acyl carrier protein
LSSFNDVRDLVGDALQLSDDARGWTRETPLLGALPELDSMSVVHIMTAIEDHFGFPIDDDDLSAETFESLGALVDFVDAQVG